ncbi:MAG: AAA family ATPase [Patescibacteria group bacterium]|jgi:predicted ATP-dependent protease
MSSATRTKLAVPAEKLRLTCAPVATDAAADQSKTVVQKDALASIELGLKMSDSDYSKSHYNVIVVGSPNTGRRAKTLDFLRQYMAGIDAAPPDLVCLYDFATPRRPAIISVPNGKGREFKKRLQALGKYATKIMPQRVQEVGQQHLTALSEALTQLWEEADKKVQACHHLIIIHEKKRHLTLMSLAHPGEPLSEEEFNALDEDIRAQLTNGENSLKAETIFELTSLQSRELVDLRLAAKSKAEHDVIQEILDKQVAILNGIVGENAVFSRYLDELSKMIFQHALKEPEDKPQQSSIMKLMNRDSQDDGSKSLELLTQVSLLADNSENAHPPVVHVAVPQYSELFGRINAQMVGQDSVRVNHTMIDGGAFLKANGGCLVLDLDDLLRWGGGIAFYKLLKVIRTRALAIESKGKFMDSETLVDFRTQETPVNVRVVAICSHYLAHALRHHEPEFDNLFRIVAEFDDELNVADAPAAYAAFVELCREDGQLPEFAPTAVAKLVEYGCRRAASQLKASTEFGIIKDVITEAAHWAREAGVSAVEAEHVQHAIAERYDRQALYVRRYQDHMDRGVMLLQLEGSQVGQINGLVYGAINSEIAFGGPKRITARAYAGKEKIVLVQREADLSGPSTNTATATIRGYISGQYGRKKPLGLAVQISFEQCYGGVDGDSATLAETIALISAITELPIDQRLAITGSMNQWGEAQPIGGANEKIEGHFGVLKRRGLLKAGHGVVLPKQNLDDLMLKEELVEAQRQGLYQVYAVSTLDEALEIFLGRPAAEIHKLVEEKLAGLNGEDKGPLTFFRKLFRRNQKPGVPSNS